MHRFQNFRHSRTVHLFVAFLVLFALSASSCADGSFADPEEDSDDAELSDVSSGFDEADEVSDDDPVDEDSDLELPEEDAFEEIDCSEETCDGDDLSECDGGVCDPDEPINECDGGSCDELVEETVVDEDLCGGQTCVAAVDYDWANATCVSTLHVPAPTTDFDSLSHLVVTFTTNGLFPGAVIEWEVPDTPGTTTATLDAEGNGTLLVGLSQMAIYLLTDMRVDNQPVSLDGFGEFPVSQAEGEIFGNCLGG